MASEKVGPKGGEGGEKWDDGSDHDGVRKIHVRAGGPDERGINFVKFDYVKDGKTIEGAFRGVGVGVGVDGPIDGFNETVDIIKPDEHLVSVEGWYNVDSNVIQGIRFITNKEPDHPNIGADLHPPHEPKGEKFTLKFKQGWKIIGFHGFASKNQIISIGAYFVPIDPPPPPPVTGSALEKSVVKGGQGGTPWTIGYNRGGLEELVVAHTGYGIKSVKKSSDVKKDLLEGKRRCGPALELKMKDEKEYVVSVEVWYDSHDTDPSKIFIEGIKFKTNTGSSSLRVGRKFNSTSDTKFTLRVQDKKIIGLYGFSRNPEGSPIGNEHIVSIGAYFVPISTTPPPPHIKLGGYGGDGSWDDGLFDGVKKVFVGRRQVQDGPDQAGRDVIAAVKFVYHKGAEDEETLEHGKPSAMEYEKPFELDYPSEYITAVDGYYDKIVGNNIEVITMLRFTTNKGRKSDPFGREAEKSFTLQEDNHKIVGFHGVTGNMLPQSWVHGETGKLLHKIGVHVLPIPTPNNPK